jgi:transcription elongation factor GreA
MNYFLTEERLSELKAELETLKTDKRIEISEKLKKAKELGDLSENAEYSEARDDQARVEQRIAELEEILRNVAIIKKEGDNDEIDIGSKVELSKNGKVVEFSIVGSNEAKPEMNLVSNESPLGKKLIGCKVGESITIDAPSGKIEYKVLKIS